MNIPVILTNKTVISRKLSLSWLRPEGADYTQTNQVSIPSPHRGKFGCMFSC